MKLWTIGFGLGLNVAAGLAIAEPRKIALTPYSEDQIKAELTLFSEDGSNAFHSVLLYTEVEFDGVKDYLLYLFSCDLKNDPCIMQFLNQKDYVYSLRRDGDTLELVTRDIPNGASYVDRFRIEGNF